MADEKLDALDPATALNGAEAYLIHDSQDYRATREALGLLLFVRVRVVDVGSGDPDADYEAGDSLDGVTLAEGDLVLRATSGGNASDGFYAVPASGAASRVVGFTTYDEHPGVYVSVMEGSTYADTLWRCTSNAGGTLDSTSLVFTQFEGGGLDQFTPASASGPASLDFAEDTDNGTNKVTLKAPASLSADAEVTLPSEDATLGDVDAIKGKIPPVINGAMAVAQRGTSFTSATQLPNNDAAITLDRWCLLSDGNDIVDVTQESSVVPTGGEYALALDVETVDKKFGILQIIEHKNCLDYLGQTVALSFKARTAGGGKLDNLKAAIIAWDGTKDAPTRDIISAWGAEDTNPTLVTNWTYENTPANLTPTTSYQTFSVSADVDTSGAKNIGLFIWSDVTDTDLEDKLYVTEVQLELGSSASTFVHTPHDIEFSRCQYWFQKSYQYGTDVLTNTTIGTYAAAARAANSTTTQGIPIFLFSIMRAAPTVTTYRRDGSGTNSNYWRYNFTTYAEINISQMTEKSFVAVFNGTASGLTTGDLVMIDGHWTASAEF